MITSFIDLRDYAAALVRKSDNSFKSYDLHCERPRVVRLAFYLTDDFSVSSIWLNEFRELVSVRWFQFVCRDGVLLVEFWLNIV